MRADSKAGAVLAWDPGYLPLKEHLIASTGMAYYCDRDHDLKELICRRLAALGIDDCGAYLEFLADGPAGSAELDGLVGQLTIGETYFFRDRQQFDALRDIVLPEIFERKRDSRRLRIWSAGCATGAEPYSLAILLGREMAHQTAGWQISILATDINRRFLAEAAEGKFPEWAFRSTGPEIKTQCFSPEGRAWKIYDEYKRWIEFAHFNLVDQEFPSERAAIADFDIILCRNVMIYFAHETTRRLIGQFHAALGGEGWFLVGSAEPNLESFTAFQLVDAAGATLYRKSRPQTQTSAYGDALWPDQAPAEITRQSPPPPAQEAAGQGELDPGAHFYRALWQQQMGNPAEAERLLRQAIYLDRGFALAHYYLGLHLASKKQRPPARRCFQNVLQLLRGRPDGASLLHGESTTAGGLAALARKHLASLEGA